MIEVLSQTGTAKARESAKTFPYFVMYEVCAHTTDQLVEFLTRHGIGYEKVDLPPASFRFSGPFGIPYYGKNDTERGYGVGNVGGPVQGYYVVDTYRNIRLYDHPTFLKFFEVV